MATNKSLIDSVIQNRVVSHVLFWLSFVLLFTLLASLNSGSVEAHTLTYFSMLPTQAAAAYLLNYYQAPRLLFKKKYILFTLSAVVSVYVFSALGRISIVYIAEPFIREDFSQESIQEILSDWAYLFSVYFPSVYIYAFNMMIIKAVKSRFEKKHQIEVLQKEKAQNELKFLKAQVQPHFLFNTLNNLYALTLAKSDLAPQVVLKLSELLDFILYQSNEDTISINKEIELIQGFIELESLRHDDRLDLKFEHNVDNLNRPIAPLMLLPLVENAFKHGAGGNPAKIKIRMDLSLQDDELHFNVYNSKVSNLLKTGNKEKSGVGAGNLQRQLELNYPNKHRLAVKEEDEDYLVKLYLDLR